MLARRLLRGNVGTQLSAPFELKSGSYFWNDINEPRQVYYNGKTYFGYVDDGGNIFASSYTHSTGVVDTFTVGTGFPSVDGDIHNGIALCVRSSDHRLVLVECGELMAQPFVRISTNAEDVTGGWSVANILASSQYTYPVLYELAGTLYLFLKGHVGSDYPLGYATSTNGGSTWSTFTYLIGPRTTNENYWRIGVDPDAGVFHIFSTDTNRVAADAAVYHFMFDGTDLMQSDGTVVSATRPVAANLGTLVQDASLGSARCSGWAVAPLGALIMVWDGSKNLVRQATWDGTSWRTVPVTDSVGNEAGVKFIPNAAMAKDDRNLLFVPRKVGSYFEMFAYRTRDGGATWDAVQLTRGSPDDSSSPDTVLNAAPELQVIWGRGTYTADSSFDFDVWAAGR